MALNVTTGEVLARASVPGYDSNVFLKPLSEQTRWQSLNPTYTQADGQADRGPDAAAPAGQQRHHQRLCPPAVSLSPSRRSQPLRPAWSRQPKPFFGSGALYALFSNPGARVLDLNESSTTHGLVDLDAALSGSCNYYF